jgi:hypothetical protein
MREHEFMIADASGRQWCKHCGALYHAAITATCLERRDAAAPASGRRVSALDDIDTIAARLAELRAERDAVLAAAEPPAPDPAAPDMAFDDCCHD